jgi:TnpA family transposase
LNLQDDDFTAYKIDRFRRTGFLPGGAMPRMQILTAAEQKAFDTPPVFSDADRLTFFHVSDSLGAVLATLRNPTNRVCLVLSVGYFRVAKRFFVAPFNQADVAYVTHQLGYAVEQIDLGAYDAKASASRHRRLTLDYLGFRPFNDQVQQAMAQEIRTMVRSQVRPKAIFLQILTLLETRKTEIPSAYALTELITKESQQHQRHLTHTIETHLSPTHRTLLDALLDKQEPLWQPEPDVQRYKLTLLKRFSQSTKPAKIKANLEDLRLLRPLYQEMETVVDALDLTPEGVRYYANAVLKSQIFQVARRADDDRHLHLVCFIIHQFLRLHDVLIDILLLSVQSTLSACEREYKERYYTGRTDQRQALHALVEDVSESIGNPLAAIETIAFSAQLTDTEKVCHIQAILAQGQEQRRTVASQLLEVQQQSPETNEDAAYHAVLESKSLKLQNRVADIVKELEFQGDDHVELLSAIQYYQQKQGAITQAAPVACFEPYEQRLLLDASGKVRVSLYKALLFSKVAEAIKAGTLNLKHSYKYRSLDDYLIPKAAWKAHRDDYLHRADLLTVADCQQTLQTLAVRLDQQYQHTNYHLMQGANPHFHRHTDHSFHLSTPKTQSDDSAPLRALLPTQHYISLVEVLSTVNRLTSFLDAFEPWYVKYARSRPPEKTFLAGVVGYGCFIGLGKIARISKWINATELETTVNGYFTLENLHAANDLLLKFMDQLELPELYRRHAGRLHTSSDGQKYGVAVESLNATYSFKYLGKDAGVSAYTFIDERHFLWHHDVISAAEREAAYVIDGLMHNDVIKSDIHSTDTHGYSEMIFGALHLLGFSFAPRIKALKRQQLYGFRRRREYEQQGYELLPDGYIKTPLIEPHWDEILRFIATIKLKETTASQLFRRLNSYAKHHPLYQALKEFGKILKSDFLLRFIDDVELRQAIEKQLNKGENANQFSKAISFGNHHAFLYGEKVEQELAEGCRRLIKNAIICWNYLYLSQKIGQEKDAERRQALLAAVQQGSVASWHHVNLHGEYDFSDEKMQDSVGLQTPPVLALSAP